MILGWLLFLFQLQGISDVQMLFDKANTHLKEQEFVEAIALYRELETKPFESGALYLNMGIAFTQLDSLGLAKAYYLQAADFEDVKTQAVEGLSFVNKKLPQKAASLPKMPWDNLLDWLIHQSISFWIFFGIASLYLSVFLLYLLLFKFRGGRWLRYGVTVGFLLTTMFFISAYYTRYVNERYGRAVLKTSQSSLYKTASATSEVVSLTFEGYEFTVDYRISDGNPDWVYVRMSNGVFGWIQQSELIQFN